MSQHWSPHQSRGRLTPVLRKRPRTHQRLCLAPRRHRLRFLHVLLSQWASPASLLSSQQEPTQVGGGAVTLCSLPTRKLQLKILSDPLWSHSQQASDSKVSHSKDRSVGTEPHGAKRCGVVPSLPCPPHLPPGFQFYSWSASWETEIVLPI